MTNHTELDHQAFTKAGFTETEIENREIRESRVCCPFHDPRHPVKTMNLGGCCDHPSHYQKPSFHKSEPGAGLARIGVA